jgi:hypothetical protein
MFRSILLQESVGFPCSKSAFCRMPDPRMSELSPSSLRSILGFRLLSRHTNCRGVNEPSNP